MIQYLHQRCFKVAESQLNTGSYMKSELFCNAKIYWYKVGAFSGWIVDNTMLHV